MLLLKVMLLLAEQGSTTAEEAGENEDGCGSSEASSPAPKRGAASTTKITAVAMARAEGQPDDLLRRRWRWRR